MKIFLSFFCLFLATVPLYAAETAAKPATPPSKKAAPAAAEIGKETIEEIPLVRPNAFSGAKPAGQPAAEVKVLQQTVAVGVDVNADLLVLYDAAVKADRNGKTDPRRAVIAWSKVLEFKGTNPYLSLANERKKEWLRFLKTQAILKRYENAVKMDQYGNLFPEAIIALWEKVSMLQNNNPYLPVAQKRIAEWKAFILKVSDFQNKRKSFAEQREKDRQSLLKILPLEIVTPEQKRDMLIKYLMVYAPFYGVGDLETLLVELRNNSLADQFLKAAITPQFKEEMKKECGQNKPTPCYLSASFTEQENPLEAAKTYLTACKGGVLSACFKAEELAKGKDDKTALEASWNACAWGGAKGCLDLGQYVETGKGIEKSMIFAAKLYEKSCKSGSADACARYGIAELAAKAEKEQEEKEAQQLDEASAVLVPEVSSIATPAFSGTLDIGKGSLNEVLLFLPEPYQAPPAASSAQVSPFTQTAPLDTTLNADLLVLYDAAVTADKKGQDAKAVIAAWQKVFSFAGTNPLQTVADARIKEWERSIGFADVQAGYKNAVLADAEGALFPDKAIAGWQIVAKKKEGNPYYETALSRIGKWEAFKKQVADYQARKKEVTLQKERDLESIRRVLPLEILDQAKKIELVKKYIIAYGPVFGLFDLDIVLSGIDDQKVPGVAAIRPAIITDAFLKQKNDECVQFLKPASCAFSAILTEQQEPAKAVEKNLTACRGGFAVACLPAGDGALQQQNSAAAKEAFQLACVWGFSRGCDELSTLLSTSSNEQERLLFSLLKGKGCKQAPSDDCKMEKKVELKLAAPVPSAGTEVKEKKTPLSPVPVSAVEKRRPYLWYGVGMLAFGVASSAIGAGLLANSDSLYKKYNDRVSEENLLEKKQILSEEGLVNYIKQAEDDYLKPGDAYSAAGIATLSIGGAALVTGLVLTLLTEEPPAVSLQFNETGFVLGYGFNF